MYPLQISKMMILFLLLVVALERDVSASRYIPRSWSGMCRKNLSLSSSPERARPAILVDLRCSILKSNLVQWKLNDLRAWTIDKNVNHQTTPANRTVIYNITVICENGANISLPWPMRVAGLIELHVTYCRLLDRYDNFKDTNLTTIADDMKILEIRHSTWILNQTNEILMNSETSLNLTSDFDCGQDSSLEVIIASNVSDTIVVDVDGVPNNQAVTDSSSGVKTTLVDSSGDVIFHGPAKPEDRLINDTTKVVSDHTNLNAEEGGNATTKTLSKENDKEIESTKSREAETDYIKLMIQILSTSIKCNFQKLKVIDESIAPVTPLHHFELMVHGGEYPVLENMNYSYTGFKEVPEQLAEWRIYFPKLKKVDLSHNYISEIKIPTYPAKPGTDVVMFDLRYNNFTVIDMDILKSWAAVDSFFVDIRDNPIHCGCEMAILLPHLADESTFRGNLAPYEYIKYLHCNTPEALYGKRLHELTTDSLQCEVVSRSTSSDSIVITLCVLLGTLIIIIVVLIKFKVEIRILLYTRLHVRLPCDTDIQRNTKTFDAFVSYSNEDAAWVLEHLVKYLESSPKENLYIANGSSNHTNSTDAANGHKSFRLCLHQRDFIPGKTIFDNIVDCIEASRHTIIVLSPSFNKSQWAMEELRQAYRQSFVEKTRHLIILLLEKVSKEEMDPLIRRCCKTFTYLDVNDSLFKDRLVFSLTTKIRRAGNANRSTTTDNKVPKVTDHNGVAKLNGAVTQKGVTTYKIANVYDKVEVPQIRDNVAYINNNNHPSRQHQPTRELSNMSTSSKAVLTSYGQR